MRFLLDENTPPRLVDTLDTIFKLSSHEFEHVATLGWSGEQDGPLFERAVAAGFDVLITGDRRHLVDHLPDLQASGLHWVGYKRKPLGGLAMLSYETSTLVGAMEHILETLQTEHGQVLLGVKGIARNREQRVEVLTGARVHRFARG